MGEDLAQIRRVREWIEALEARTMEFAVRGVKLAERLETTRLPRSVIWQFVDAVTSTGANHRACRRARSDRELFAKLSIVDEESDETEFWLDLIQQIVPLSPIRDETLLLRDEAAELRAIFAKARATVQEKIENE